MFKSFSKNFDSGAASHIFVGRKAGRLVGEFLDKVGKDNLSSCIANGILITEALPIEYRAKLKEQCQQYKELLPAFSNTEVYGWIPQQHRSFIEATPGGKAWAEQQLVHIRAFLLS